MLYVIPYTWLKVDGNFRVFDDEDLSLEYVKGADIIQAIYDGVEFFGYKREFNGYYVRTGLPKYDYSYNRTVYEDNKVLAFKSVGIGVHLQSTDKRIGWHSIKRLDLWYKGFAYIIGEITQFEGFYFDKSLDSAIVQFRVVSKNNNDYTKRCNIALPSRPTKYIQVNEEVIPATPCSFGEFSRKILMSS